MGSLTPLLADALLPYDQMRATPLLPSFLMLFTHQISTLFLATSRNLKSLGTPASSSEQGGLFLFAAPMAQQLQSSSTQVPFLHLFFNLSRFQAFSGREKYKEIKIEGELMWKPSRHTTAAAVSRLSLHSYAADVLTAHPWWFLLFFNFFPLFLNFKRQLCCILFA